MVITKLRVNETASEVQELSIPMDRKVTQTSALQLTDEEVEWMYGCKNRNSMAETEDSELMVDTNGCEGSVKVIEVIKLDMSVADQLVIKHRLRIVIDQLFTGFRSIKVKFPELLKQQIQTIVSLEAITIMNSSTSINEALLNCLSYPAPVVNEWLYDTLEDCFEGDCDKLTSVEQEYMRKLLDCLYAMAKTKLKMTGNDECQKKQVVNYMSIFLWM